MVELNLLPAYVVVEFAVAEHSLPINQRSDGPALKCDAVPGTPTTLRLLVIVPDCLLLCQVNENQISIVPFCDPTFVDQVPDACWCVTHPVYDAFDGANAGVDAFQHERQGVLHGR